MKLAVGEVLVAVAGITGNSMSLTDGDSAVMLTRYDGGEEKINELRKEVENNCDVLEPAPIYPNEEESFWKRKAVQMQSLAFTATYGVMSTGSCCWRR